LARKLYESRKKVTSSRLKGKKRGGGAQQTVDEEPGKNEIRVKKAELKVRPPGDGTNNQE